MKTKSLNIRCFDNGGETIDRYTVVYLDNPEQGQYMFACVGMSENPFSPQGFGQHSTAMFDPEDDFSHLGKEIQFSDLPSDCQKLVLQNLA